MARPAVAATALPTCLPGGRRREMNNDLGKAGNTLQGVGAIEVGKYRYAALLTPESDLRRIANQGVNAVMAEQSGQETAGNISAADDQ